MSTKVISVACPPVPGMEYITECVGGYQYWHAWKPLTDQDSWRPISEAACGGLPQQLITFNAELPWGQRICSAAEWAEAWDRLDQVRKAQVVDK